MKESINTRPSIPYLIYGFCSLLCLLALAGCSLFGDSSSGGSSATPTPAPATLTTYKGDGYTIRYPQGWKVSPGSNGIVTFSDPQGIAYLALTSQPNPQGAIPPDKLVDLGLQLFKSKAKNYQKVAIASTTKVAGEDWSQGAATGDVTPEGQSAAVTVKIVDIATNHPAQSLSTHGYTIAYATGQQVFDMANQLYFQSMVSSFAFA